MTSVSFDFRLVGTGWAEARFAIGDSWTALTASYLGDALGDLVAGVRLLAEGADDVAVSWEEEPNEFQWRFRRDADQISVQVTWFDESHPARSSEDVGEQRLVGSLDVDELVEAVARGARTVLDEHGEAGYLERWVDAPFPVEDLLALERRSRESAPPSMP